MGLPPQHAWPYPTPTKSQIGSYTPAVSDKPLTLPPRLHHLSHPPPSIGPPPGHPLIKAGPSIPFFFLFFFLIFAASGNLFSLTLKL